MTISIDTKQQIERLEHGDVYSRQCKILSTGKPWSQVRQEEILELVSQNMIDYGELVLMLDNTSPVPVGRLVTVLATADATPIRLVTYISLDYSMPL